MRLNDLYDDNLSEGIWDEFKAGYRAGKEEYVRRQAAKMGLTVSQAVQQAQAEPPGSNAPPKAAASSQFGAAASGMRPSSVNVKFSQPQTTAPVAKPMSYGGSVKASLGGTSTAYNPAAPAAPKATPTASTTVKMGSKPRMSVRAATGTTQPPVQQPAPTLSGGPKGVGNPEVDPATGWPKGAEAWAAGPLPSRQLPSVAPSVAAPATKPTDYNNVLKTLDSLSKREQQRILTQLLSRLGTPIS